MFNLVNSFGGKRDEYGVGDLLAEVSKRSSSISAQDRKEIADISKRLRGNKPKSPSRTPQQTPDNSQHDGTTPKKIDYGKDLLKVGLLRGFGSQPPVEDEDRPTKTFNTQSFNASSEASRGVLLRGFGPSKFEEEEGSGSDVDDSESGGFEENHNL